MYITYGKSTRICVYDASVWAVSQPASKVWGKSKTRRKKTFYPLGTNVTVCVRICADRTNGLYAKCFIHHSDIEYMIIIGWWFRCGSYMAHVSSRQREPRCDAIRIKSIERWSIHLEAIRLWILWALLNIIL